MKTCKDLTQLYQVFRDQRWEAAGDSECAGVSAAVADVIQLCLSQVTAPLSTNPPQERVGGSRGEVGDLIGN